MVDLIDQDPLICVVVMIVSDRQGRQSWPSPILFKMALKSIPTKSKATTSNNFLYDDLHKRNYVWKRIWPLGQPYILYSKENPGHVREASNFCYASKSLHPIFSPWWKICLSLTFWRCAKDSPTLFAQGTMCVLYKLNVALGSQGEHNLYVVQLMDALFFLITTCCITERKYFASLTTG